MGKNKSAAAVRQQQRAKARDEKAHSTSASEVNTPETRSRTPESEASHGSSDNEEIEARVQWERYHNPPDVSTLEAILQELALDTQSTNNLSQLISPITHESPSLYEIRSVPGKGLGLFALVDIPAGTRIMADKCLFHVIGPKAMISEIESTYENLSPKDKKLYQSLRCPDFPGKSPVIRRWEANCFGMDHDTGIFPLASRINHSCTPNALFKWNSAIDRLTVHAIVHVPAGAEIETCYTAPHRDAATRRERLAHYGFECQCAPCTGFTEEGRTSEQRRVRVMEVLGKLESLRKGLKAETEDGGERDKLELHFEAIQLLEEEKLFMKELGEQYRCVAEYCAWREGRDRPVEYARKALRNDVRCFGADSPLVRDAMGFLRSMKGG